MSQTWVYEMHKNFVWNFRLLSVLRPGTLTHFSGEIQHQSQPQQVFISYFSCFGAFPAALPFCCESLTAVHMSLISWQLARSALRAVTMTVTVTVTVTVTETDCDREYPGPLPLRVLPAVLFFSVLSCMFVYETPAPKSAPAILCHKIRRQNSHMSHDNNTCAATLSLRIASRFKLCRRPNRSIAQHPLRNALSSNIDTRSSDDSFQHHAES